MENSKKVLYYGERWVNFGRKVLAICGLGAPILWLIFLIAHYILGGDVGTFLSAFIFDFLMADGIQAIVVILIYLSILLLLACPAFYAIGMHYIGIGQAAINTAEIAELLKAKQSEEITT